MKKFFPIGTHHIDKPIVLKDGDIIEGEKMDETKIVFGPKKEKNTLPKWSWDE